MEFEFGPQSFDSVDLFFLIFIKFYGIIFIERINRKKIR